MTQQQDIIRGIVLGLVLILVLAIGSGYLAAHGLDYAGWAR